MIGDILVANPAGEKIFLPIDPSHKHSKIFDVDYFLGPALFTAEVFLLVSSMLNFN